MSGMYWIKMKTYKKGETVFLCCTTRDFQSTEFEKYTLEEDMTQVELEKLAEEFFWASKEPEWWVSDEEPESRY